MAAQQFLGNATLAIQMQQANGNVSAPPKSGPVYLPYQRNGPPAQKAGTSATKAASGAGFNSSFWKGLPQEYRNLLQELEHQWQTLTGFNVPIKDEDMVAMAQSRTLTLSDFGQYMWGKMSPQLQTNMPWAEFGISKDDFHTMVYHFGSVFKEMTGVDPSADVLHQALTKVGGTDPMRYTAEEWHQWLIHDKTMQDAYGWIKYGLNREQFDTHKQEMRQAFGMDLSDAEGVKQLQYFHAAQPDFYAATAQPEKKPTEQAVPGMSVAR